MPADPAPATKAGKVGSVSRAATVSVAAANAAANKAGEAAPAAPGAGRQAGWRPLSLYEAEEALSERLGRLIAMVGRLRTALHHHHGADSPLNDRIDQLEDALIDLEGDVDHVTVNVLPGEIN